MLLAGLDGRFELGEERLVVGLRRLEEEEVSTSVQLEGMHGGSDGGALTRLSQLNSPMSATVIPGAVRSKGGKRSREGRRGVGSLLSR